MPDEMIQAVLERIAPERQKVLLEAGLARVNKHVQEAELGLVASDGDADEKLRALVRYSRGVVYRGPFVIRGQSQIIMAWRGNKGIGVPMGSFEKGKPNVTLNALKKIGNNAGQKAVIHAKKGMGYLHHLDASDTPGKVESLGKIRFDKGNDDPDELYIFETVDFLAWPLRSGMFNPHWKPYV